MVPSRLCPTGSGRFQHAVRNDHESLRPAVGRWRRRPHSRCHVHRCWWRRRQPQRATGGAGVGLATACGLVGGDGGPDLDQSPSGGSVGIELAVERSRSCRTRPGRSSSVSRPSTRRKALGQLAYQEAADTGSTLGQAYFGVQLGGAQLAAGQVTDAASTFEASAEFMRQLALPGRLVWSLAGAVQASAQAGHRARSDRLLAELDAVRTPERLLEGEVERARAWNALAHGAVSRARQILAAAAATAGAAGMIAMELGLLHDLVRLGDATDRERVTFVADRVEGALAVARHDHMVAVIDRDGPALDAVAEHFEQLGADLLAAEASAHAATAHARRGRDRSATASRRRALELATRCQGARTPALDGLGAGAALTEREREIATLAAGGLGNRAIAAQLFVSLRTVENHLAHVYTKLGVTGRDGLAAALGTAAPV